jgi:signal peptidase II
MRKWTILITALILVDQITKRVAEATLEFAQPIPAIPMFNWMLVYNEGAAFSFLSQAGGWQRWFFVALASAVSLYIFNWLRKLASTEILLGTSLSLILSGALGNLIDRAIYGKVTDFIEFYFIIPLMVAATGQLLILQIF